MYLEFPLNAMCWLRAKFMFAIFLGIGVIPLIAWVCSVQGFYLCKSATVASWQQQQNIDISYVNNTVYLLL